MKDPKYVHYLPDPFEDIKKVDMGDRFSASNSRLYASAEFGRDARQLAIDALIFDPTITKRVVVSLVKRQAWKRNDITEAQPGKFHHEHRELFINGKKVPQHSEKILKELSAKWGGTNEKVTYYGSFDITPDAVSLIAELAIQDKTILQEKVVNQDRKKQISIKESARQGIQWVMDRVVYGPTITPHNDIVQRFLEKNKLTQFAPTYHNIILRNWDWMNQKITSVGQQLKIPVIKRNKRVKLLEFQRANRQGITYQGWMDGGTSLIHSSGKLSGILADYRQPIATIEMQGSAIDALEKAAFLFPKKEKHFRKLADEVRENVLKYFWMEDKKFFAMAADRDKKGNLRKIETYGANVGELLNSTFFDTFLLHERQKYIGDIITRLFSNEFLTDAGIRTRAKSFAYLTDLSKDFNSPNTSFDYWDYQGSETSWIVQTGRIAEGLRKQGFYTLAQQLDNRILNTVNVCGFNTEYVYVGARGILEDIVAYNIASKQTIYPSPKNLEVFTIYATNVPESTQTWTASRVAAILHRKNHPHLNPQTEKGSWQEDLEQIILSRLQTNGEIVSLMQPHEVLQKRQAAPLFIVDQQRGKKLEEEIKNRSENFYTR